MNAGMNMLRLRENNVRAVLMCIHKHGEISRKDIAEETGLTQAALTQITAPLLKDGLLMESGRTGKPGAGRKKVLLTINPSFAYILTVNVDRLNTVISITDLEAEELASVSLRTSHRSKPYAFLDEIVEKAEELKQTVPVKVRRKIRCISVGMVGDVDHETGIVAADAGLWKKEVDVAGYLKEKSGLEVIVENNVNAYAMAEKFYTQANLDNILVIKWGPGVGSALLIHSELYEGNGRSEFGHIMTSRSVRLEDEISEEVLKESLAMKGSSLSEYWQNAGRKQKNKVTSVFEELARAIVNTCVLIRPSAVILYGSLVADDWTVEQLEKQCIRLDPHMEGLLHRSLLAEKESCIGPCAAAVEKVIF